MKSLKKNNVNILNRPATSPDLNVIENIWDIIDKKKNLQISIARTLNDLQQIIFRLRSEISIKTYENLVQSMPERLQNCIGMKGKNIFKILTLFYEKNL